MRKDRYTFKPFALLTEQERELLSSITPTVKFFDAQIWEQNPQKFNVRCERCYIEPHMVFYTEDWYRITGYVVFEAEEGRTLRMIVEGESKGQSLLLWFIMPGEQIQTLLEQIPPYTEITIVPQFLKWYTYV
ncbi:MAG: hypothetical protein QMC97_01755 [Pseudothermotoga sp.]|uniref:hypothetical protein n=1 Tax=Pseudothermotoga sp. TaxID=2033661 RepID=UPI00183BE725|nr:hypothetical protein [Pseudothermotoga sp.]MDI6862090.1 hypothetical protein [Pseudothermotoga sp.]